MQIIGVSPSLRLVSIKKAKQEKKTEIINNKRSNAKEKTLNFCIEFNSFQQIIFTWHKYYNAFASEAAQKYIKHKEKKK